MIHPEKGNHANHPGHDNHGCPLRLQINAAPYGTSHNGYACSHTGGHCRASDACAKRVEQHESEAEFRAQMELLVAQKENEMRMRQPRF